MKITPWLALIALFTTAQAHAAYTLKAAAGNVGDCEEHKVYRDGKPMTLPDDLASSMQCPVTISLNRGRLVLLKGNDILLYRLKDGKRVRLFGVWPDINGLSAPLWSPDGRGVALVSVINNGPHAYKTDTRIIALRLNSRDKVVKKEKFDVPIHYGCGAICTTAKNDVRYASNRKIVYRARKSKAFKSVALKF